jgi:hypothetical protein
MRALGFVLFVGFVASCGGPAKPARESEAAGSAAVAPTAYDATGAKRACQEPPAAGCPKGVINADFNDECRRAGYRVVRCGCEDLCTGNVAKVEKFYDASGLERPCAPEQADCTPPDTSAAFQDACTDAGHKLVICGCEWLCNGQPAKGSRPSMD